jgi:hypothetical protein
VRSFWAWQPYDAKYVSEGAIEIHIRVIVFTGGFATIATVLEVILRRLNDFRWAILIFEIFRSRCDFDCVGLCGIGFAGYWGFGGLRGLYSDVQGVPDACAAGGGGKQVPQRGGAGAGGEELNF